MTNTRKTKKVNSYNVKKELAKIDEVFKSIKNDKSLPTFLDFFLGCLIKGNAENVNLKVMYPKVHKKLNILLEEHRRKVLARRK